MSASGDGPAIAARINQIASQTGLRDSAQKPWERMGPMSTAVQRKFETMRALPGDDVRQILWRFADRYDLQMLVQSARAVARGPVARLVAAGARNTHEWTAEKPPC